MEDAAQKISRINKDMNGPDAKEIKSQIQKNGLDYIKKIQNSISDISKKMNNHIKKK